MCYPPPPPCGQVMPDGSSSLSLSTSCPPTNSSELVSTYSVDSWTRLMDGLPASSIKVQRNYLQCNHSFHLIPNTVKIILVNSYISEIWDNFYTLYPCRHQLWSCLRHDHRQVWYPLTIDSFVFKCNILCPSPLLLPPHPNLPSSLPPSHAPPTHLISLQMCYHVSYHGAVCLLPSVHVLVPVACNPGHL